MVKKKETIGFHTSSKDFEDAFAEVQAGLSKKKGDWATVGDKLETVINNMILTAQFSKDPDLCIAVLILGLYTQIGKVGIELTETHERLARIEKMIKELKKLK